MIFADREFRRAIQGKVVKGYVTCDVGGDEPFPGVEFTDGTVLIVQRDPEGNGPGFMQLEKNGEVIGCAGGT